MTCSTSKTTSSQYSVAIRYPQEYEEVPGETEVNAAVKAAYTIRTWVRTGLRLE
jgi:hypothetical protein